MAFDEELDALYQSRIPLAPTPQETTFTAEPVNVVNAPSIESDSEGPLDKPIQAEDTTSTYHKAKYEPKNDPRIHRTVFVGNVTIAAAKKPVLTAFKKLFTPFGEVESIRFRSIPFQEGMPGKWAKQARPYHAKRESMHAYVVMREEAQANQAIRDLNGTVFEQLHLRVDAATPTNLNAKRSVFVGGLDYNLSEEQVWRKFGAAAGEVQTVRLIRDEKTGLGRGIAYVQFKEKESVKKANGLSGTSFENKVLRVQPFKKKVEMQKKSSKAGVSSKLPRRREKTATPLTGSKKKEGSRKAPSRSQVKVKREGRKAK